MASRGGGRGPGGFGGDGRGRGPGGRGGDGRGRGPGGRGPGCGVGYGHGQQQPYGRGGAVGRGGGYPQPYGRGEGGGRGGGGRGRGGGEVPIRPAAPRPVAPPPIAAPRPVAPPVAHAEASTPACPHPPPATTPSPAPPPPSPAASAALARDMERLAEADPAPRAPAPPAKSEAPEHQLPPVSSKGIVHPARPDYGKLGTKIMVRANHFVVQVAEQDSICHYDVLISPEPKARRTNRVLLSKLVEAHAVTTLGSRMPAYDGSKSLYTAGELPFKSMDFVVKLGKEPREIEYKITIRYAGRADLYHLQQFLLGRQRDSPQDTIQALDIVLRESPSLNYVTVSRSFFSKGFGHSDIGEGLECWRGYYQSLRPTQMGLSLNIDISSTAFYKPIPVIEFVQNCVGATNPKQPITDRDRLKLKKALCRYHLQYTAWPCLQSGNDSKPIYLPMEVCQIIEGQKYPKKLSSKQVTQILRATCERPEERQKNILQIVSHNNYSADRLAQVFGINVDNKMASVEARVLPPPTLKYHDSGRDKTCVPSSGQWNMFNKKLVNGGNIQSWTCLNFSNWPTNEASRLCGDLVRKCNSMGMVFNQRPVTEIRSAQPSQIEAALRDVHMRAPDLKLLIVILPVLTGHYGKIKRLCETELGIVSQCINPKSNINNQYFENVALKINVKVGGRNTVLERAIMNDLPFVSDIPTIIFGADVTHPAAGEDSLASIAAVVASMDLEATTYKALVSDQAHRQEIIQDLFWTDGPLILCRELLLSFFQKKNKKKPKRIIFYRMELVKDSSAMFCSMKWMQSGRLVLLWKRVIYPGGNILPGTVVDTSICHPSEFDFYLCSHAGIKGTSRPAHYHVLYDENGFKADDLQMLTNSLCFTYARCTRSVSLVPPVYYAHLAAFRARYYDERDGTDAASVVSGGTAGGAGGPPALRRLPKVKENVKNVMFFC
ncbi:hypothetical protein QOZ80_7AG0558960 [Eleusine coracana subsp. coracana]|nr:hypothetical protein QOZ80_7AG0558960 [Eleusine coracana subsp. coracana]